MNSDRDVDDDAALDAAVTALILGADESRAGWRDRVAVRAARTWHQPEFADIREFGDAEARVVAAGDDGDVTR